MYKNPALYQTYMEECEVEHILLEHEYGFFAESIKRESHFLNEHLMPKISEVLAKPSNREKLIEFTGKFIDEHSTQLLTSGPVFIFTFGDKETSFLYELFNLDKKGLLELFDKMVNAAYEGQSNFSTIRSSLHKVLVTAMIIESINKNYTDIIECGEYLIIFATYPLIFRNYWKIGAGVKEDVMEYTIEHLPNKFIIKKQKNLLGLLKYIAHSSLNSHANKLKSGIDSEYIDFINRVRNQLNSAFKNIATQYYANYAKNATMHTQSDKMDDGKFIDNEGTITNISLISENTYNKFLVNGVNTSIAGAMANGSTVSKEVVISYLNKIYSDKNNRLGKFIENIVYLFLSNEKYSSSSINSEEFINFGLSLFRSLGTSKVEQHKQLKAIEDYWMNDVINILNDYTRDATLSNFRRSIFNYFIFMIKYYN